MPNVFGFPKVALYDRLTSSSVERLEGRFDILFLTVCTCEIAARHIVLATFDVGFWLLIILDRLPDRKQAINVTEEVSRLP